MKRLKRLFKQRCVITLSNCKISKIKDSDEIPIVISGDCEIHINGTIQMDDCFTPEIKLFKKVK